MKAQNNGEVKIAINTTGADGYVIPSALAKALVADGYDLGAIVAGVKAQKGRSKLKEATDKLGDVRLKEASETTAGQSTFKRSVTETYVNDLSAPMRFAAYTDAVAALFKRHGEPAFELSTKMIPAHLQVWIAVYKTDAKTDAKPKTDAKRNGTHAKRNGTVKPVETPAVTPAV